MQSAASRPHRCSRSRSPARYSRLSCRTSPPLLRGRTAGSPRISRRALTSSATCREHRSPPAALPLHSLWGPPAWRPMLGAVASERDLKPVYLLTGTDRPKISVALQRLRGRIGEDATEQLHAAEASGEEAV